MLRAHVVPTIVLFHFNRWWLRFKKQLMPNTYRRRRRDSTRQLRRVGVGGVYWALCYMVLYKETLAFESLTK